MRKFLPFIILSVFVLAGAFAQNRNTAKALFNAGNFEEAKPMFESLLKKSPKNSEYNYWYAACCIETNDTVDVEAMLEFAASRNIVKAFWYLGDWYSLQQDYS